MSRNSYASPERPLSSRIGLADEVFGKFPEAAKKFDGSCTSPIGLRFALQGGVQKQVTLLVALTFCLPWAPAVHGSERSCAAEFAFLNEDSIAHSPVRIREIKPSTRRIPEVLASVKQLVELAIRQYEARRGWSRKNSDKLRGLVERYWERSTYYEARDRTRPDEPVIGVLRMIEAPYAVIRSSLSGDHHLSLDGLGAFFAMGMTSDLKRIAAEFPPPLLPLEEILATRVPRTNATFGLKWTNPHSNEVLQFAIGSIREPGNFFVDHTSAHRAEALIALQEKLAISQFSESNLLPGTRAIDNWDEPAQFSFGDAVSVRMYKRMGFRETGSFPDAELGKLLSATGRDLFEALLDRPAKTGLDRHLHAASIARFYDALDSQLETPFWSIEDVLVKMPVGGPF